MYAFAPIVKNFTAVPRFAVAVDIVAGLNTLQARVDSGILTTEVAFHTELRQLVATLRDGHTTYTPPGCMNFAFFVPIGMLVYQDGSALTLELNTPFRLPHARIISWEHVCYPLSHSGSDTVAAWEVFSNNDGHVSEHGGFGPHQLLWQEGEHYRRCAMEGRGRGPDNPCPIPDMRHFDLNTNGKAFANTLHLSRDAGTRFNLATRGGLISEDFLYRYTAPSSASVVFSFTDGSSVTLPWAGQMRAEPV